MHLLPKVFRTEGDMADFDPSKILESIVRETGMDEKDAKHITELVVRRFISSGIKFLSGPHIREVVCSILSEQHFEQERKLYTRIGMPLMDYEEILEKGLINKPSKFINPEKIHHWAANQLAEEYTLLRILSDEESKAHLFGNIHIHQLKYFDLRPLSQTWDSRIILKNGLPPMNNWTLCSKLGPAADLKTAVHHLSKWLGMTQGEFSGNQGYDFITTFLAPFARGLNEKEIKYAIQDLIHELNQLPAIIARDVPATIISCSPIILDELSELPAIGPRGDTIGVYKDYNEECLKIFDAISDIYKEGDACENSFEIPKHSIYFNEKWLNNYESSYSKVREEIYRERMPYLVNLCAKWLKEKIKDQLQAEGYFNRGVLQNISLNLPRYAYLSKTEDGFEEILLQMMELSSGILLKKHEIIKKRLNTKHLPICSSLINDPPLFYLDLQDLAVSVVGLNEAVKFLTNDELHENPDSLNFGLKIVKKISDKCVELSKINKLNFILQEYPSRSTSNRFANLDLKHFPELAIPQSTEMGNLYTTSFHFRDNIEMDLLERIKKQGKFHSLVQNNVSESVPLIEIKRRDQLKQFLTQICVNSEIACVRFVS